MDKRISVPLRQIFEAIESLRKAFPIKRFTIDGRLVGDIGEVIAEREYAIELFEGLVRHHDAKTRDGRNVQIKATFKDSLTFSNVPELYLGFKLLPNGEYEEVFNGPGMVIQQAFAQRKGIGKTLLSFPIATLRQLSSGVRTEDRVPRRKGNGVR